MRTLLATLLLLAFLTVVVPVPAAAQEAAEPTPFLVDPAGDISTTLQGQPIQQGGVQSAAWTTLDLLALNIVEDPAGFRFEVQVVDLGGDDARADAGNLQVRFAYDGAFFYLNLARSSDNAAYFGSMYRGTEEACCTFVRGFPVERDLGTDRVWTTVDRFDIEGAQGTFPGRGDAIQEVRVLASASAAYMASGSVGLYPLHVGDVMAGADGLSDYAVLFGGGDSNGVVLSTPQPFRASNGEATTYQFTLAAKHGGDATARYRLSVDGLPDGWNVTLPGTLIELPAGTTVEFPLYLNTTFTHRHGTAATFQVHLHEEGGERWAMAELGVNFLAVPQPAGHHPDLWLHSNNWGNAVGKVNEVLGGTNGFATMNTLEDDPGDTRVPVAGYTSIGSAQAVFHWSVCLEPSLLLGLDFDLDGTGAIELPMSTTRPMPGATLAGRLMRLGPGAPITTCIPNSYADRDVTILAELAGTATDLAANSQGTVTASIVPTPESDYVPAEEGAALVLELTLTTDMPGIGGSGGVMLLPGGHLVLPLNEYHDAIQVIVPDAAQPAPGFVSEPSGTQDAPAVPMTLVLVGLAALVLARRNRA